MTGVTDDDFRRWFLHPGLAGCERFAAAVRQTADELAGMFARATGPYSGCDPDLLLRDIRSATERADGSHSLEAAIELVADQVARHAVVVQHPRCAAHLHTPPLLPGVVAELFIAALNQSMDSWDQAPAATFVEIETVRRIAKWFGFSEGAEGVFTSGATQSNFMGLWLARDATCRREFGHDVRQDGLPAEAGRLRVLCSETSHFSVTKSVAQLGLGGRAVVPVAADPVGRVDPAALAAHLRRMRNDALVPLAVVGTAGTTDHGAVDPLDVLADMAAEHRAWFHVDAAYGGGLVHSRARDRLAGIGRADSLAIDFHKFLYQPISCGVFLLRDGKRFRPIEQHADYLNRVTDPFPNLVDKSVATTRRFDALKVWLTLQCVSEQTLGAMVDHVLTVTTRLAEWLSRQADFELLAPPQLSTILFRRHQSDAFQRTLRLRLLVTGRAVLGETVVAGRVALKLTLLNPCLTDEDGYRLFELVREGARELEHESHRSPMATDDQGVN